MKPSNSPALALGLGLSLCAMPVVQSANASETNAAFSGNTLEEIIVVGVKRAGTDTELEAGIEPVRVQAADSAGLIASCPGVRWSTTGPSPARFSSAGCPGLALM